MRYQVLATDYDGTLAHEGRVDAPTLQGLQRLLASGRRLVMVTGRELPDLKATFSRLDLFELVVAENGALLYQPATREEKSLVPPPPDSFLEALRQHGVPISVGKGIVATWEPHQTIVLEVIRQLGLELQVIFNKGAVMILPAGVNKASGLTFALTQMRLSPHNVVGVGDAENDHAFLRLCECSVAVSNALPTVKEAVEWVTSADHGAGVVELIDALLADDLRSLEDRLTRHHLPLGTADGAEIALPSRDAFVLIADSSASENSPVATGLLKRLIESKYQVCVVDPEGAYENVEGAFVLGGADHAATVDEVLRLLENPEQSGIVSLTSMATADRPAFFLDLLSRLQQMQTHTGRPHWLMVEEAHQLMPAGGEGPAGLLCQGGGSVALITAHPDLLSASIRKRVNKTMQGRGAAVGGTAVAR